MSFQYRKTVILDHSYSVWKLNWHIWIVAKTARCVHHYQNRLWYSSASSVVLLKMFNTSESSIWPDLLLQMLQHSLYVIYRRTSVVTWREPQRFVLSLLKQQHGLCVNVWMFVCMHVCAWGHWKMNSTGTCHIVWSAGEKKNCDVYMHQRED